MGVRQTQPCLHLALNDPTNCYPRHTIEYVKEERAKNDHLSTLPAFRCRFVRGTIYFTHRQIEGRSGCAATERMYIHAAFATKEASTNANPLV